MENFINYAKQILTRPSWDTMIIFGLLAILFFYGTLKGKWRIASMILYAYAALVIASAAPLEKITGLIGGGEEYIVKSGVFLAVFLLLALLLGSRQKRNRTPTSSWWQIFLLSAAQIALSAHIIVSFLPQEKARLLSPLVQRIFVNPDLNFWWLAVPLVILVFLRRFAG